MDSELRDRLDIEAIIYDKRPDLVQKWQDYVEAARKVANLHESIDLDRLEEGLRFAHITDSDAEYLVYVARQVQVALGITEAPDGQ